MQCSRRKKTRNARENAFVDLEFVVVDAKSVVRRRARRRSRTLIASAVEYVADA